MNGYWTQSFAQAEWSLKTASLESAGHLRGWYSNDVCDWWIHRSLPSSNLLCSDRFWTASTHLNTPCDWRHGALDGAWRKERPFETMSSASQSFNEPIMGIRAAILFQGRCLHTSDILRSIWDNLYILHLFVKEYSLIFPPTCWLEGTSEVKERRQHQAGRGDSPKK